MKTNPRTMKLLGSVAVFATLAGGYFLVVNPLMVESAAAAQEIEDAEANVLRLEKELTRVTLIRDGIADIQAIDAEISRHFPSAAQIPQLTNEVLAAAERAGLSPEAVTAVTAEVPTLVNPTVPGGGDGAASPDPAEEADPAAAESADPADLSDDSAVNPDAVAAAPSSLAEMSISVAATGNTQQLAAFLRELSNMERAFLISSATLAGEPGEEGSLAVSGKTFLYRPVVFPTDQPEEGEVVDDTATEGEPLP